MLNCRLQILDFPSFAKATEDMRFENLNHYIIIIPYKPKNAVLGSRLESF